MTWRADVNIFAKEIHVWPDSDLIQHTLRGADCVCGPRLEQQDNGKLMITHNSLDGRELSE